MKSARLLALVPLLFASCAVVRDWNELRSAPMTQAECYDGIVHIAKLGGYPPDASACDRGLATWQSRWRPRQYRTFDKWRYRLRVEMLLDEGSADEGWLVRYLVEQQQVKDMVRRRDPEAGDWSDMGQDPEAEAIFGGRLSRRLGVAP